jgi:sortase (surface protein transpeptidase)
MSAGRLALLAALALVLVTVPTGSEAAGQSGSAHAAGAAVKAPASFEAPGPSVGAGQKPVADSFRSPRSFDEIAPPVRLRIPAIHVDSPLDLLGRQPDGTIAVPASAAVAGWYDEGPRPGQPGPAVVLGHVDSRKGPGVFFRLVELKPGTLVYVDRADGTSIAFRVQRVSQVPKTSFPTDLVYSPTLEPSLQLVTCGGTFDNHARSYRDNVIAYTSLA